MNKKILILFLIAGIITSLSHAQIIITSDSSLVDSSAFLEMKSHEYGWLIPRMTTQQRDSIQNPAEGLMIYNLDSKSIEYFNGSWVNVNASAYKNAACGTFTVTWEGITYGTVPFKGRCWLDRNLGASKVADSVNDPLSYGYYYQWGRGTDGHQFPNSNTTSTLATNPVPGHDDFIIAEISPYDWLNPQNQELWNESSGFFNNPCPQGWMVPNLSEWLLIWVDWQVAEDAFNTDLKLPGAGYRAYHSGELSYVGSADWYWMRQPNTNSSFSWVMGTSKSLGRNSSRAQAMSIRCIRQNEIYTPVSKLYGLTQQDYGTSIAVCPAGGLILTGYTQDFSNNGYNYLLLKLNYDGSLEWSKMFGFVNDDYGFSVIPTIDGGFIINGVAGWGSTYNDQMYIVKTDSGGNMEWDLSYGSTGEETGCEVIQDTDSGFVFVGYTNSFGSGGYDTYFRKNDQNGNSVYSYAYGTEQDEYGKDLVKDTDGGYAVSGYYCCEGGFGAKDMYFFKLNPDLSIDMSLIIGGTGTEEAHDLVLSHDSGYVLAGYTSSYGNGSYDYYLKKLNSSGSSVWTYTFGGTGMDVARSIIRTSDNGFAIAGYSTSFSDGWMGVWLMKIDMDGQFEWSWVYHFYGSAAAYSLAQAPNGNFYTTGALSANGICAGQNDVLLVEFNADGSACLGYYVDPTGDRSLAGNEFHSEKIHENKVVITKVYDDIKPLKMKVRKLKNDMAPGQKTSRDDITPVVTTICE